MNIYTICIIAEKNPSTLVNVINECTSCIQSIQMLTCRGIPNEGVTSTPIFKILTHKIEFIPEKRRVSINDRKLPINWYGW